MGIESQKLSHNSSLLFNEMEPCRVTQEQPIKEFPGSGPLDIYPCGCSVKISNISSLNIYIYIQYHKYSKYISDKNTQQTLYTHPNIYMLNIC